MGQPAMNASEKEPLYLVDGSSFIFRAYYGLPPLTNPQGVPVNAVLGFVNMLTKLLTDLNAHSLAIIFDAARKNFRNEIYSEYKANRSETPEDLIPQFPIIRDAVKAFNLPCLELEGYEADDLIATYARLAKEQGRKVVIVSSDKDLLQLLDDNTSMLDTMKNKEFGLADVMEKFGVTPDKVVEVQSLIGDSVDNVPGVPGIGPKTAAELINQYGDLENLLAHAHEIKQAKRRESLIEFAEQARISRKLVLLDAYVPIPVPIDDLDVQMPENGNLIEFLRAQGFKTTLARIQNRLNLHTENRGVYLQDVAAKKAAAVEKEVQYITIEDEKTLQQWVDKAFEKGIVAIDTETTGLTPAKANLVGVCLSVETGRGAYVPLKHNTENFSGGFDFSGEEKKDQKQYKQIPFDRALAILKPLLESPAVLKVGHNIKYDAQFFNKENITVNPIDDTLLMSYILDGSMHGHGMDELAELFLDHKTIKFKDIVGTGKNQKTFDEVDIETATQYAAEDADITLRLYEFLKPRLAEEKMTAVYEKVERPMANVLAKMELTGIKVDPTILKQMSHDFSLKLAELEKSIHEQAGMTFNIASPKQLGEVLFEKMGLPLNKKSSKSGALSTAQNVLEPLAYQFKIVEDILEWRQVSKLKSTYTDALQEQINPKTGRVHTSYMMSGTTTGRLSSTEPNLQNIPIRSEDGKKVRTAFVAEKGYKLVSIDYSQVELRLAAELAGVETLKQAFKDGMDIHAHTASQVFNVPMSEMTPDLRRQAKAINFGIIYGISGFGLAKQIGADVGNASKYIDQYLARFPELKKFMEDQKEYARKHGYVKTLYGRKCMIQGINDKNYNMRQFGERQAINAPLQGTAADIIKKAMIAVDREITQNNWPVRLLLQVHDELVFEIEENAVETYIPKIVNIMENIAELSVPLMVEAGVGDNWANAH